MPSKVHPKWQRATLITVKKHRNANGELEFEESVIERKNVPKTVLAEYERIWEQRITTESYQCRIYDLLKSDAVVLKVVEKY